MGVRDGGNPSRLVKVMSDIVIHPDVTETVIQPEVDEALIRVYFGEQGPQGATGPSGAPGYYGAFSDYTDQTTTANTAKAMTFNTTDESRGVSIVAGSQITFAYAGTYNLQWSGQFENTANTDVDISVWLKKNGNDVVGSTGFVSLPKNPGTASHVLPSWNFVLTAVAGDYFEFWWSTTGSQVSLQTYPATTGPVRPSTASIVLTVTPVMNNVQGPQGDPGVYVGTSPPANTSLLWVDIN